VLFFVIMVCKSGEGAQSIADMNFRVIDPSLPPHLKSR
jgi:hypothetical protein